MFSRLRDRTYTTPFREKKAKTQGQLNGNVKLAGSEYGRINVSIDTALILYRRNRTLQIILMSTWYQLCNWKNGGKSTARPRPRFVVLTGVGVSNILPLFWVRDVQF